MDPSRTAVLFIEFQNEFTTAGGKLHDAVKDVMDSTDILTKAPKVAAAARASGIKVLHAPITFDSGYPELPQEPYGILAGIKTGDCFLKTEWGAELCEAMRPQAGDVVVEGKRGLCAFHSTNLDFVLRHSGVETLVLAGFLTNCCVESTMRGAYERGFKVYTLTDVCAATSQEAHDAAVKFTFPMFSTPLTSEEFLAKLA